MSKKARIIIQSIGGLLFVIGIVFFSMGVSWKGSYLMPFLVIWSLWTFFAITISLYCWKDKLT